MDIKRISVTELTGQPGNPHIEVFEYVGHQIAGHSQISSVVIDLNEFNNIIDDLEHNHQLSPDNWQNTVNEFRKARIIPMAIRGAKTEWLFSRFNLTTNLMCMIVRGEGKNLAKRINLANWGSK